MPLLSVVPIGARHYKNPTYNNSHKADRDLSTSFKGFIPWIRVAFGFHFWEKHDVGAGGSESLAYAKITAYFKSRRRQYSNYNFPVTDPESIEDQRYFKIGPGQREISMC